MEIHNNKTKFNGNWISVCVRLSGDDEIEMGRQRWVPADILSSLPFREWITKISHGRRGKWIISPASINVSPINIAKKTHTFYCNLIHRFMFVAAMFCVWSELNLFFCLMQVNAEPESSQSHKWRGIGEAAEKYVCCACYQRLLYFIFILIHLAVRCCVFLLRCVHSLLRLLNCDGIMKL